VSVSAFPSNVKTPCQALLQVQEDVDDIDQVAIIYIRKGEDSPRLTCSTMQPVDMNFLGFALQNYSLSYLEP
jgi:hypothetical protein